jgi:PadR family transcriptional regulator, regulatory protein PadR
MIVTCSGNYYLTLTWRLRACVLFFPRERQRTLAPDHQKIEVRPRNWLTPVALVILRKEPSHGYELMERLEEFGFEQINSVTLYRTLKQMENEGLCKSELETPEGGPARRAYSVTNDGEAYLTSWAEECKKYQLVLDSFYLAHSCR